jgi:hypothetical protein
MATTSTGQLPGRRAGPRCEPAGLILGRCQPPRNRPRDQFRLTSLTLSPEAAVKGTGSGAHPARQIVYSREAKRETVPQTCNLFVLHQDDPLKKGITIACAGGGQDQIQGKNLSGKGGSGASRACAATA